MFALMVVLLVVIGYDIVYYFWQIGEGEHTHEMKPSKAAGGMLVAGVLFGFMLYALLHWI